MKKKILIKHEEILNIFQHNTTLRFIIRIKIDIKNEISSKYLQYTMKNTHENVVRNIFFIYLFTVFIDILKIKTVEL